MVASAIFITDRKGKPIISRNYRGNISPSIIDEFQRVLVETEDAQRTPVFNEKDVSFCFVEHNDLFILGVTSINSNAMLMLNFLNKIVSVFEDYFNGLEQESIRDNFVIIYELLDEMCDFGYPQHTDAAMLKDYICVQEKHKLEVMQNVGKSSEITTGLTGQAPWRKADIVYKKNEVFLDIIEKLNLLVANNGSVLHSEIVGSLKMKAYLSGMPELKLGLNDKIMMEKKHRRSKRTKTIEMDDINFHQCVKLTRFENDRTISFIPPDGEFELMNYRLDQEVRPLIWIEAHRELKTHSRVEYTIKCKSEFKRRSTANNVEILIPVPADVDCPTFKESIGTATYVPESSSIRWTIKQLPGQKEYLMRAHFGLPSVTATDAGQESEDTSSKAPINIKFELPYFTVSGIQVRYLKIVEKSGYQAMPWVRYITQNGDYCIRV